MSIYQMYDPNPRNRTEEEALYDEWERRVHEEDMKRHEEEPQETVRCRECGDEFIVQPYTYGNTCVHCAHDYASSNSNAPY